nr:septum formation initiator family protein [Acidobacteriota bacterium]
ASRRLSHRLTQLEVENAGLREQARRLADDPAAIERAAREDLGLIKPGEILVVVKDVKSGR